MSYDEDSEYLEIRKKKEEELRKRLEAQRMIRMVMSEILTEKAMERLDNVSLVYPDLAEKAKALIIQLVQAGKLKPPVGEEEVKRILAALYAERSKGGKIEFKRK